MTSRHASLFYKANPHGAQGECEVENQNSMATVSRTSSHTALEELYVAATEAARFLSVHPRTLCEWRVMAPFLRTRLATDSGTMAFSHFWN